MNRSTKYALAVTTGLIGYGYVYDLKNDTSVDPSFRLGASALVTIVTTGGIMALTKSARNTPDQRTTNQNNPQHTNTLPGQNPPQLNP